MKITMMASIFEKIGDLITGVFAIIPQTMYFLYASVASLLDVLQLLLRKVAGLDTYYIDNTASGGVVEKSGDVLQSILEGIVGINSSYSALSVVFWSMIIFGVIVLTISTILKIIKAHYNYDAKKSHPMTILKDTLKSLFTMAIVPFVVVFGMTLSQIMFKTLDDITSVNSNTQMGQIYENEAIGNFKSRSRTNDVSNEEEVSYISYDMYGVTEYSSNKTFSGMLFKMMASQANRVSSGAYSASVGVTNSNWDNAGVFYTSKTDNTQEILAEQINFAFENCLTLKTPINKIDFKNHAQAKDEMGYTLTFFPNISYRIGLINVKNFSKFNIGLVWYYYNLWAANFIIGFAGAGIMLTLLSNIVFGLFKRLFLCTALFLVYAPLLGITPLDDGNGFKSWRKEFLKYAIASYGAVLGMNLFFIIVPVLQGIEFFGTSFLNEIFNLLIMIAGLTMIKKFISLISSFVGGADLNAEGGSVKKEVGDLAMKAGSATVSASSMGLAFAKTMPMGNIAKKTTGFLSNKHKVMHMVDDGRAKNKKEAKEMIKKEKEVEKAKTGVVKSAFRKAKGAGFRVMGTSGARAVMGLLGVNTGGVYQDFDYDVYQRDESGNVMQDAEGKNIKLKGMEKYRAKHDQRKVQRDERGRKLLRGGIDLTGTVLKAVGDVTCVSSGIEALKKSGLTDGLKMFAQEAFTAFGNPKVAEDAKNNKSFFTTAKQKSKHIESKEKESREALEEINLVTQQSIDRIQEIVKNLRSRR